MLCSSTFKLCWDLGVIGLKAKRVGGLEENQPCLAIISGKAIIVFLGKVELILNEDVMIAFTGKGDSSRFGIQCL